MARDPDTWRSLRSGLSAQLVGVPRELTHPIDGRGRVWFPSGDTPTRIVGIYLGKRLYFAADPYGFLRDFPPVGREEAHIDENEFTTDVLRTSLWVESEESCS